MARQPSSRPINESQIQTLHPAGKESADALALLGRLNLLREEGTSDVQRYVQELTRTSEDSAVSVKVQQGASLLKDLIELRSHERRQLAEVSEAMIRVIEKFRQADGAWSQACRDLDVVKGSAADPHTQELLDELRQQIQKFLDVGMLSVLQTLGRPLKQAELAALIRQFLGRGEDAEGEKSTLEANVVVETIRQKYAHPLLLTKLFLGDEELSDPARVLLNTFQELSRDFPPAGDRVRSARYLLGRYEDDPFLGPEIKRVIQRLDLSGPSGTVSAEPTVRPEPAQAGDSDALPAPMAMARVYYKTTAAKTLDSEAGSLAPGGADLLDETMQYIHQVWKESLTWEPHPNHQPLRFFRDHLVRVATTGQAMEFLFHGYREVRRYQASEVYSLDTWQLLSLPSVRELVCVYVNPKLRRLPGFSSRALETMLGRQYATVIHCCREIANMDVFVHDEWPENFDEFLRKFHATYDALILERPGALRRCLGLLHRPI